MTSIAMLFCFPVQNFTEIRQLWLLSYGHQRDDLIWRHSDILNFRGPKMGSLKSPYTTSYRSSMETIAINCLVSEKIDFLHFGDRQTNRQTDGQARRTKPLSLSRAAA